MSIHSTHYVVLGVCINDKQMAKYIYSDLFNRMASVIPKITDNPRIQEVKRNNFCIHLIDNIRKGQPFILGKIITKRVDCGYTKFSVVKNPDLKLASVIKKIGSVDREMGTAFSKIKPAVISFTLWW